VKLYKIIMGVLLVAALLGLQMLYDASKEQKPAHQQQPTQTQPDPYKNLKIQ
jgi:hypothetical protein